MCGGEGRKSKHAKVGESEMEETASG